MDREATIKYLRQFFKVSLASLEFAEVINKAIGQDVHPKLTAMKQLHTAANIEVHKDEPDLDYIDKLMERMEILSETT